MDKGQATPTNPTTPSSSWPREVMLRLQIVEENKLWIRKMDPQHPEIEYYINKRTGEKTNKKPACYDHIAGGKSRPKTPHSETEEAVRPKTPMMSYAQSGHQLGVQG